MDLRTRALVRVEGMGAPIIAEYRVKEICHRLDEAGYRQLADLIRARPPTGAQLSHQELVDLRGVLEAWIGEADSDALTDVVKLREALENELEAAGEDG